MSTRIIVGDALSVLRTLPSASVHMCVTSPPYYGLRDYGTALWNGGDAACDHLAPARGGISPATSGKQLTSAGTLTYQYPAGCGKCGATRVDKQIGLEATPELWVAAMVAVFREVWRVLRSDGTIWINVGDSYAGSGKGPPGNLQADASCIGGGAKLYGLKPKDLLGIPWLLAFALRADGWYLRSEIIWAKPNPMPESVTDRPTKAHEQLFLLSRSRNYYYDADAIREAHDDKAGPPTRFGLTEHHRNARTDGELTRASFKYKVPPSEGYNPAGRNKRSVWTVATEPFPESHFATYPTALIEPCIKAGTSERGCCATCGAPWVRVVEVGEERPSGHSRGTNGKRVPEWDRQDSNSQNKQQYLTYDRITTGWRPSCAHPGEPVPATVLDCFGGAGTTALVADRLGRNAILVELNPEYAAMAGRRINGESPMFSDVSVA